MLLETCKPNRLRTKAYYVCEEYRRGYKDKNTYHTPNGYSSVYVTFGP